MSDPSFASGHPSFGRQRGAGSAIPGPPGPGGAVISVLTVAVASASQLNALASGAIAEGEFAAVASLDDAIFQLKPGARAVDNITVVNAVGKAGFQWVRQQLPQMLAPLRAAWAVDTAAGNDENTGAVGAPLKTLSELARRLAFNEFTTAVTTTYAGNAIAGDLPDFTFILNGGTFAITGTPVLLHSGTVTTVVAAAAVPAADDTHIIDAGIPVSWTASGLLATGVMFQRNGGAASNWWGLKDLGGAAPNASLRISTPTAVLANGNLYDAFTLPTVNLMRFADQSYALITLTQLRVPANSRWIDRSLVFTRCWMPGCFIGPGQVINSMLEAAGGQAAQIVGTADRFQVRMNNCAARGAGADILVVASGVLSFLGSTSLQAVQLLVQSGFAIANGPIRAWDCTTYPILALQFAHCDFSAGSFFSGTGNAKLARAQEGSMISHTLNPNWVAGSSTDLVTPILVDGTAAMTVAAESGGAGVVNVQQNGIFLTS